MPKATACWLIENTTLSFKQISEFVGLHLLEIQAIADGEVSIGMLPRNPVENGELTEDEIKKCEKKMKKNHYKLKKFLIFHFHNLKLKELDIPLYPKELINQMVYIGWLKTFQKSQIQKSAKLLVQQKLFNPLKIDHIGTYRICGIKPNGSWVMFKR